MFAFALGHAPQLDRSQPGRCQHHRCAHDGLRSQETCTRAWQEYSAHPHRRALSASSQAYSGPDAPWESIRIALDTEDMRHDNLTNAQQAHLDDLLLEAVEWVQDTLSVVRVLGNLTAERQCKLSLSGVCLEYHTLRCGAEDCARAAKAGMPTRSRHCPWGLRH